VLIGMAALGLTALAACTVYRWQQRKRVRRIEQEVKDYLSVRYDGQASPLNLNYSDDALWPVLVAFDDPRTRIRHSLQFACARSPSTFSLLSEKPL
jgi:hypothetical protein